MSRLTRAGIALTVLAACNQTSETVTPPAQAAVKPSPVHDEPSARVATAPELVVAKLNACTTAAEALPLMTGMMKDSFASRSPEEQALVLSNLQVEGLPLRTLRVSDTRQYVIVDRSSLHEDPLAFFFEKVGDDWKFSNRTNAHAFVVDLLTGTFTPHQFDAKATVQQDDETYVSKSAFASFVSEKAKRRRITIDFYPFELQERDLEYLKTHFGLVVQETGTPTTITSSVPYARFDVSLAVDEHDQLISFCLNGGFFPNGRASYGVCGPSIAGITELSITSTAIKLVAKGETEPVAPTSPKRLRWDIDVNVPLFKKGLD